MKGLEQETLLLGKGLECGLWNCHIDLSDESVALSDVGQGCRVADSLSFNERVLASSGKGIEHNSVLKIEN